MSGEFELISKLRQQLSEFFSLPDGAVGAGADDAAVMPMADGSSLVLATDMLLDGVHFQAEETPPHLIGRKALAVNLSDIAAMGAIPHSAVVSVAIPRDRPGIAEELHGGLFDLAREYSVPIVGGDTNVWSSPLVINVAVTGKLLPGEKPFLRSGAQPGDWILSTGPFGGSLAGHHLTFVPRVHEARAIRAACTVHSMIDVSDGLAADLHHVLRESGTGAVLYEDSLPIAAAAAGSDSRSPLDRALGDGEDFELVFTVTPEDGESLLQDPPLGIPLFRLGEITNGICELVTRDGSRRRLDPTGWEHS